MKLQALGLRPATLLKKETLAQFLRTPFLQNTSGWLFLIKLHDPKRRKIRLHCFKLRWLNGMNMPWHSVFSFLFFLFGSNVIRESFFVFLFFPESIIPKILGHSYVQSSLSTITSQLDSSVWKTPYNWIFYGHRCQACTKPFNLLLYAFLSLKQT